MNAEIIYFSDSYVQVTSERIVLDVSEYPLEDVTAIHTTFTRVYGMITLSLDDGSERSFAPSNRAHAIAILDALSKALGGLGCEESPLPWSEIL